MQKKGMLITIEGCEGVGKSTQINMLKGFIKENGINALFLREPGGTDIGEQIRSAILSPENEMDCMTELFLYSASRNQLNKEVIAPALKSGKIVFCDRYIDSTTAYQGYARGMNLETIEQINRICLGDIDIDLTIFLDLNPKAGFERKGGADKSDRIDSESISFHQRVYAGYKEIAKRNKRVKTVDASGTTKEVFERIVNILKKEDII